VPPYTAPASGGVGPAGVTAVEVVVFGGGAVEVVVFTGGAVVVVVNAGVEVVSVSPQLLTNNPPARITATIMNRIFFITSLTSLWIKTASLYVKKPVE